MHTLQVSQTKLCLRWAQEATDYSPLSNFLPSGSMSLTSKISSNKMPAIPTNYAQSALYLVPRPQICWERGSPFEEDSHHRLSPKLKMGSGFVFDSVIMFGTQVGWKHRLRGLEYTHMHPPPPPPPHTHTHSHTHVHTCEVPFLWIWVAVLHAETLQEL